MMMSTVFECPKCLIMNDGNKAGCIHFAPPQDGKYVGRMVYLIIGKGSNTFVKIEHQIVFFKNGIWYDCNNYELDDLTRWYALNARLGTNPLSYQEKN